MRRSMEERLEVPRSCTGRCRRFPEAQFLRWDTWPSEFVDGIWSSVKVDTSLGVVIGNENRSSAFLVGSRDGYSGLVPCISISLAAVE